MQEKILILDFGSQYTQLFAAWLITRLPVLRTLVLAAALGYLLRRVWVGYRNFGK